MDWEAIEAVSDILVKSLSKGRRKRAVPDVGSVRGFQTDLSVVTVPFPSDVLTSVRCLTIALALQSSPTKEAVSALPWPSFRRSVQRALSWVEGEHAIRWAISEWPGLKADLEREFPWVDRSLPVLDPAGLMAESKIRASSGRAADPPVLFGRLPPPTRAAGAGKNRHTAIGTRWTQRKAAKRTNQLLAVPVCGPSGEDVTHPGESGSLEALTGQGDRQLGIPYDEWDYRLQRYRRDYVRVVEIEDRLVKGPQLSLPPLLQVPPLMPSRHRMRRCEQGDVDVDSVVEYRCELIAGTFVDDPRLFAQLVPMVRPTAFALLIDASASSAKNIGGFLRNGIMQANALARSLTTSGQLVSVFAFRSRSHERVEVILMKDFDSLYTPFGQSLRPAGYTRFGAAIRHVGQYLGKMCLEAKTLVIFGDAVPSDEGYDGRYGQEDVAKAVAELRNEGIAVHHVLPEAREGEELDFMFGRGGWRGAASSAELGTLLIDISNDIKRSEWI